jgi:hypothetical protein
MNREWHEKNPFVENVSEEERMGWREIHKDNCNCGRMLLPYRQTER